MPSPTPAPVLQVQALHLAHPGQPPLFECWSFTLPAGLTRLDAELGKTSLLRALAGDLPVRGRFTLNGAPWQPAEGGACWIDPRSAHWDALTPDALVAALHAQHPGFDAMAWERHVAGLALTPHRHKTLHMLSTGSRRKVALAATLAANAPLSLLDEPTAGLDAPALAWLAQALAEQAATPDRAWLLAAAWGLEDRLPWAGVLAP